MEIAEYRSVAAALDANGKGLRMAVAMDAESREWPWKRLRLNVRGNCRGDCRVAVAMVADGRGSLPRQLNWQSPRISVGCYCWHDGVKHEQNRGHDRGSCRGNAMSRDTCHKNPRISTVAVATPRKVHESSAVIAADLRQKVKKYADVTICCTLLLPEYVMSQTSLGGVVGLAMRVEPRRV